MRVRLYPTGNVETIIEVSIHALMRVRQIVLRREDRQKGVSIHALMRVRLDSLIFDY